MSPCHGRDPMSEGSATIRSCRTRARSSRVGPVTARKLRDRSITTVAEVARLGEPALVRILGRAAGRHLHALAHNRDPRRVDVGRRRRSIGTQRALGRRPRSPESLDADILALVDRLARRLRAAHRVCRTVVSASGSTTSRATSPAPDSRRPRRSDVRRRPRRRARPSRTSGPPRAIPRRS